MASRNIHLKLFDVAGPTWQSVTPEQIDGLMQAIQDLPLQGIEPDRYGIRGVNRIDDVIGGYFAVQYEREILNIDDQKKESRTYHDEWEQAVFVFFPRLGKVLLQSRQYPKGLTDYRVNRLFRETLRGVIGGSNLGLGYPLIQELSQRENVDETFIRVFDDPTTTILRLVVNELRPDPGLSEVIFYNPQKERNRILSEAFTHDFALLESLEMDVGEKKTDLQKVFIAKAAVRSGANEEMKYADSSGHKQTLRRKLRENYDASVDVDVTPMREEDIRKLVDQVLEQYGLYKPPPRADDGQMTIFDYLADQQ